MEVSVNFTNSGLEPPSVTHALGLEADGSINRFLVVSDGGTLLRVEGPNILVVVRALNVATGPDPRRSMDVLRSEVLGSPMCREEKRGVVAEKMETTATDALLLTKR